MSYKVEIADNLDDLKNGRTKVLGSIMSMRTFQGEGPVKTAEFNLSNIDNKFSFGIENLLNTGQLFLLSIDDEDYMGGIVDEINPFGQTDTMKLILKSWEERLNVQARPSQSVKPARRKNSELISELIDKLFKESGVEKLITPTVPARENNALLEKQNILTKIRELESVDGFKFSITPRLLIKYVQAFKERSEISFEAGVNITKIRPEITNEGLFNKIVVRGRKSRKQRTVSGASNNTSDAIFAISADKDSIQKHGLREKTFILPLIDNVTTAQEIADRKKAELDRIGFRFYFETPFANLPVGVFTKLSIPKFNLSQSPDWKIFEVQLMSSPKERKAMVVLEKRFPAPFNGVIS